MKLDELQAEVDQYIEHISHSFRILSPYKNEEATPIPLYEYRSVGGIFTLPEVNVELLKSKIRQYISRYKGETMEYFPIVKYDTPDYDKQYYVMIIGKVDSNIANMFLNIKEEIKCQH